MAFHEKSETSNQDQLPLDGSDSELQDKVDNVRYLSDARDERANRRYDLAAEALREALEEQDIEYLVDTMGISYEEAEERVRGSAKSSGVSTRPVMHAKPSGKSPNEGTDRELDEHWNKGAGEWLTPDEVNRRTIGLIACRKALRDKKTSK